MNEGAAASSGAVLLFLHADTIVPRAAIERIPDALASRPRDVGGAFRFRVDSARRRYRVIEWGVALRCRWLGLPYGDQALFVLRDAFESLGGFRRFDVGEDLDFVRRLRRLGPLLLLDEAAMTSARRWERGGFARTTLRNWATLALFAVGLMKPRSAPVDQSDGSLEHSPGSLHSVPAKNAGGIGARMASVERPSGWLSRARHAWRR